MKKSVLFLSLVMFFVSCSSLDYSVEKDNSSTVRKIVGPNSGIDFEEIGQVHNEGLDYAFSLFNSGQIQATTCSTTKINDIIEQFIVIEKNVTSEDLDAYREITSDIFVNNGDAGISMVAIQSECLETEEAKSLANEIKYILETPYLTKENIELLLDNVAMQSRLCLEEDAIVLQAMCSVGKASMDYWSSKVINWGGLVPPNYNSSIGLSNEDIKKYVMKDLTSAGKTIWKYRKFMKYAITIGGGKGLVACAIITAGGAAVGSIKAVVIDELKDNIKN